AGAAGTGEAFDAERVEHVFDVVGDGGDGASRVRRRAAVPGTVVADEAKAAAARVHDVRLVRDPAARRAVVEDDGGPVRIAVLVEVQRTAVAQRDVAFAHPRSRRRQSRRLRALMSSVKPTLIRPGSPASPAGRPGRAP